MARRSSLAYRAAQRQRELERAGRARARQATAQAIVAERARKAYEKAQAAEAKDRARLYVESRSAEVDAQNEELAETTAALEGLLRATLSVDDYLDFESLKEEPELPPFQPGDLTVAGEQPTLEAYMPTPLSALGRLVPGAGKKYERASQEATERFNGRTGSLRRTRAATPVRSRRGSNGARGRDREDQGSHR